MLLICKSILLLVSFLCHVIETVHDTEKGNILHASLRKAPKPQARHRATLPQMPTQPQDKQPPSASKGSHQLQTAKIHNKAQLNTKDIYSQEHFPPHHYRSLKVRS